MYSKMCLHGKYQYLRFVKLINLLSTSDTAFNLGFFPFTQIK